MNDADPSRHARTVAVSALVTGFVLFVLAVVLALAGGDGGGGGGGGADGGDAARTGTATQATSPRRPSRGGPPAEPRVAANAPGARRAPDALVPVLAYNVINEPRADTSDPSIWVPREEFEAQMEWLDENGYHAVTMRQVWAAWKERGLLPSRPVVVSFDTGYHSVHSNALPIMRERRFPGTLLLDPAQTEEDFPASEVRALIRAGWELGAHPGAEGRLTGLDEDRMVEVVSGARRRLRREFNRRVQFLSYPEGAYDQRVLSAVRSAGFLGALTLDEGLAAPDDPPYLLKRIPVRNGDGAEGLERKLRAAGAGPG